MTAAVGPAREDARRWGISFALILALHAVAAWIIVDLHPTAIEAPGLPPAAVMLDLAPLPVETPIPQVAAPPPPPVPEIETIAPPAPAAPQIAVPVPPPPPKRHPPVHEAPKPVPDTPPPAVAAPPVEAPAVSAPPAPVAATKPSWQGLVLARLEQLKRYPPAALAHHQQGVASLRIRLDRSGHVLSAKLEKSAGFSVLDDETLALARRADPLPAPPPEVPGDPVELVVPVEFFVKQAG